MRNFNEFLKERDPEMHEGVLGAIGRGLGIDMSPPPNQMTPEDMRAWEELKNNPEMMQLYKQTMNTGMSRIQSLRTVMQTNSKFHGNMGQSSLGGQSSFAKGNYGGRPGLGGSPFPNRG